MKNFIIPLMLMLCLSCKKDHVNNTPIDSMLDENKVWYISQYPDNCQNIIVPFKVMLGKDTTINSEIYKPVCIYSGDTIESKAVKKEIYGFLRETTDKKVYWYVNYFDKPASDILLHDFNAKINDTIHQWVVTKVDTIKVQNISRKRITLVNYCFNDTKEWIDGIGDMAELLRYFSQTTCEFVNGDYSEWVCAGCPGYKQVCVTKGNELIFKDSDSPECWIYRGCD
jgi:hypothetical protein